MNTEVHRVGSSVRENVCSNPKNVKSHVFLDFEKRKKRLKAYVCRFKNHLITPVVNAHYTITESQYM